MGCAPVVGDGVEDGWTAEAGAGADAALEPEVDAAVDAGAEDAAVEADAWVPRGERPRLAFPVHPDDRALMSEALMFGFDHGPGHDRTVCTAYDGEGFPACYGGHEGSDFILQGGFRQMDAGSARVVAAAGGEVVRVEDGHYDRCRVDLATQGVTCDGHEMRANQVTIRHPNGWQTRYLHLMNGSVVVREGMRVDCERVLGLVGSSGFSTMPHLHLEVVDPQGRSVDPFEVDPALGLWRVQDAGDVRPANGCDPAWGPAE